MTREGDVDYCCPRCGGIAPSAGDGCNLCGWGYLDEDNACVPYRDVTREARLHTRRGDARVFWSPAVDRADGSHGGGNSYVLEFDDSGPWLYRGHRVRLLSINGVGEIRWVVRPQDWRFVPSRGAGGEGAVEYFGLKEVSP